MKKKELYKKEVKFFCVFLFCVLFFIGCTVSPDGEDNDSVNPAVSLEAGNIAKVDIADAKSLFIGESNTTYEKEFYKITGDGQDSIQKVTYQDSNGEQILLDAEPEAVYDVNETWVILVFDDDMVCLVSKIDGTAYSLSDIGKPEHSALRFINGKDVQTDTDGNIYYCILAGRAVKINTVDPNNLSVEMYTPSYDRISSFSVSASGDVIYFYNTGSTCYTRIMSSNKSLYDLTGDVSYNFWTGMDGKIKWWSDYMIGPDKVRITTLDGFGTYPDLITSNLTGDIYGYIFPFTTSYYLALQGKAFIVSVNSDYVCEVENSTTPYELGAYSEIDDIVIADASDNFYYLAGKKGADCVLVKINPDNGAETKIAISSSYDIKKMSVSSDDKIDFVALNMGNSNIVVGNVSEIGAVTIISDSFDGEVIALERIE